MKKVLSILLSVCLIFCTASVAFAEDEVNTSTEETTTTTESITPVVIVPGVGSSGVYENPNTKNEGSPIDIMGTITTAMWKSHFLRTTLTAVRGGKVDASDYIDKLSLVAEALSPLACDENGNSKDNIGINCNWTDSLANHTDYLDSRKTAEPALCKGICDAIGAENVYMFNYDFRLDVVDDAIALNDFIDNVKKEKNCDKVTIVSASLGTSVASAYIDIYMDKDDIEKSIFLDGAFNGVSVSKMFGKDLIIDKDIIMDYLQGLADTYPGTDVDYASINNYLGKFDGTVDNMLSLLNDLTDSEHIDEFYSKVLLPLVGNMPSLWECIPYEDFDNCVIAMENIGFLKEDSGLYEKIMRYHEIQGRLFDNITELQNKGVELAVICGYGFPGMPCTSDYKNTTDMLIDTKWESLGGTISNFGETLDGFEDGDYISPDSMINASSGLLPENTWYCKYVQHMEFVYDTDINKWISEMITTKDFKLNVNDVIDATGHGQFVQVDSDHNLTNVQ